MLMSLFIVSVYADEVDVNVINEPPVVDDNAATTTSVEGGGGGKVSIPEIEISSRVVADVESQSGAQVRVMQLIRNIETNINGAELILQRLEASNNQSNNETSLNESYDRLSEIVISLDVIVAELEDFNYSQLPEDMAQEFVMYKSDATALTTEFRELVSNSFTEEEKSQIRSELNEIKKNQREEFKERIDENKRVFHAQKIEELLTRLNIEITGDEYGFISQLEAGNISIGEARQQATELIREENQNRREEIRQQIREDRSKKNIEVQQRVENIKESVGGDYIDERDERLEAKLIQRIDRIKERINQREENAVCPNGVCRNQEKLEQVKNKRLNALDKRIDKIQNNLVDSHECEKYPDRCKDYEIAAEFLDSHECEKYPDRCKEYGRVLQLLDSHECEKYPDRCREYLTSLQELRENLTSSEDEETPQACTREYIPVCAQPPMPKCPEGESCSEVMPDLQTFPNECEAKAAKAEIQYQGVCREDEETENNNESNIDSDSTSQRIEINTQKCVESSIGEVVCHSEVKSSSGFSGNIPPGCVRDENGNLHCWGMEDSVTVSGNIPPGCVRDENGNLHCWGMEDAPSSITNIEPNCVRSSEGDVKCGVKVRLNPVCIETSREIQCTNRADDSRSEVIDAQNHNSSRSNRTNSVAQDDTSDEDLPELGDRDYNDVEVRTR